MAAPLITPTANSVVLTEIGRTSTNITIPTTGTPTFVAVTNLTENAVFVRLGTSGITVDITGVPILSHSVVFLALETNTTLAAICFYGIGAVSITPST